MSKVAEVLARKGGDVYTIEQTATVFEAIERMVERNLGSLVIMDGDSICGIFTERDYLRRIVVRGRTSKTTKVQEVLTSQLICVSPSEPVEACMAIMTQRRIRHLPVMDGGRLVGIVSIGDLVRHVSKEREIEVRYLTDYITGNYPG